MTKKNEKAIKKEEQAKKTEEEEIEVTKKPTKKTTKAKKETSKAEDAIKNLTKDTTKAGAKRQRDLNEMISVVSISNAPLLYVSSDHRVRWSGFLEEEYIEYKELIKMKNSHRAFFSRPWIVCDWEVLEDLGVTQYYKDMIDLSDLDGLFAGSTENMIAVIERVPLGVRRLIADRAYEKVLNETLDSVKMISTIEKACDVDLTVPGK